MSTIVATAWLSGRDSIGVIITKDPSNPREMYKARIGVAKGFNEEGDLNFIKNYGTRLNIDIAESIIKEYGTWLSVEEQQTYNKISLEGIQK